MINPRATIKILLTSTILLFSLFTNLSYAKTSTTAFDCKRFAAYKAAKTICKDNKLGILTKRITNLYQALAIGYKEQAKDINQQKDDFYFKVARSTSCTQKKCLSKKLDDKLSELSKRVWKMPVNDNISLNISTDKNNRVIWVIVRKKTKSKKRIVNKNPNELNIFDFKQTTIDDPKYKSIAYTNDYLYIDKKNLYGKSTGKGHMNYTPANYSSPKKVFDVRFVKYSKEFALDYGYPIDDRYIADFSNKHIKAMTANIVTKGIDSFNCFYEVYLDKDLDLMLPKQTWIRRPDLIDAMPSREYSFVLSPSKQALKKYKKYIAPWEQYREHQKLGLGLSRDSHFNKYAGTIEIGWLDGHPHESYDDKIKGGAMIKKLLEYLPYTFLGLDYLKIDFDCRADVAKYGYKNNLVKNRKIWIRKNPTAETNKFWQAYAQRSWHRDDPKALEYEKPTGKLRHWRIIGDYIYENPYFYKAPVKIRRQRSKKEYLYFNIPQSLTDAFYQAMLHSQTQYDEDISRTHSVRTRSYKFITNQQDFNK